MTTTLSATLIGMEGAGKTQLCSSITERRGHAAPFHGSTVTVEQYISHELALYDTPGILLSIDNQTTQMALDQLEKHDTVLVVARADHLINDLKTLLPLVASKQGGIIVSFFDQIPNQTQAGKRLDRLAQEIGVPIHPVNGRQIDSDFRKHIYNIVNSGNIFRNPTFNKAGLDFQANEGPMFIQHLFRFKLGLALALMILPIVLHSWCLP